MDYQARFKGCQRFTLCQGGSLGIDSAVEGEFANVCFESGWYQIVAYASSCVVAVGDTNFFLGSLVCRYRGQGCIYNSKCQSQFELLNSVFYLEPP